MKYIFETFEGRAPQEIGALISGNVAIVAASWEDRSKAAVSVFENTSIEKLIVIRFSNPGKSGVSRSARDAYKALCKRKNIHYSEVIFDSVAREYVSLVETAREIDAAIVGCKNVIIDITSTPRLLWCSLLCLWNQTNSVRKITFLYARPKYSFNENPNRELIYDYTEGDWLLREPAFFAPFFRGGLAKTNFISVGYEYDQIKRLIYKFESDNNIFVYSDPGFEKTYTELAQKTVAKIRNVFEVPDQKFMAFAVNDFLGLYRSLSKKIADMNEQIGANILIVSAGSKIHSLALLFSALENTDTSFRVRVPTRYKEVSTGWANRKIDCIVAENVFCPV